MSVPIISENSGLFLLTKDVPISPYQPYATESPTGWAATNLPTGLSINATTGEISGTPTTAQTKTVALVATNGSGDSAPLTFVMKVVAAGLADEGLIDLNLDLQTGLVTNPAMAADVPQSYGKDGDVIGFALGFVRDGALRSLDISNIKVSLRDTYEDLPVTLFDDAPGAPLDALAPRYRVKFAMPAADILAKLQEHDSDGSLGGTDFEMKAKCDIEVTYDMTNAIGGATEIVRTFVTFHLHLAKAIETT